MRRLSSVILILVLAASLFAQKSPHGESFKTNCGDCHKTDGWKVDLKTVSFDHNKTKFQLVGQHREITCTDCHKSLDFAKAPTECNDCHTDIHEQTVGNECARCHTPNSWMVSSITQLHQLSRFPLIGPHTVADCKDCHKNLLESASAASKASRLRFDPLGVECYDCHKNNYIATTAPNHVQSNYSTSCEECHKMNSFTWGGATFNHNLFPLEGVHKTTPCTSCHTNGYANTPNTCAGCHMNDYNQTTKPNHTTSLFPTTCETCHNPSSWVPSTFNHSSVYPLTGAHITTPCESCHTTGYVNTPNTCAGCHINDYNKTTNPNHTGALFPTTCETCHSNTAWVPSTFDHTLVYPLTGAHTTVACNLCHTNGYVNTPNTCAGCHINDYNKTTNPNHTTALFPTTCETCHSNTAWVPSTFNHTLVYPLTGAHTATPCALCHTTGYVNTPNTCAGCHINDYNKTTNPNHTTALFPTTCETCHSNTAWVPSTFNHSLIYPLTGAHTTVACNLCHANGYVNTPNTCVGCHQNKFNQTTNPNHSKIGISTDCQTCHTTNPGWAPATFAIHNTYYVLTGAHVSVTCDACHKGNYNTTPNTCAGCHTTDYNQATNPNHIGAQFPNTCADCHSQSAWVPSTWSHTAYFPITSGNHHVSCTTCHTNSANYAVFTCVTAGCHATAHNQNQGSAGCYSCHPKGQGG